MDVSEHLFLRHVPCRWLTLKPALERIVSVWEPVVKYFTDLPKDDKSVMKMERYKTIMNLLKDPATFIQLQFLIDVSQLFTDILSTFQSSQPLIHLLHKSLVSFLQRLMLRFIRTSVVGNGDSDTLLQVHEIFNRLC